MRLRSSTKVSGVHQRTKSGPPLKKSSPTLDSMPIVVLDSLIERLDPKSLLALKNTNKKLAKAIRSNRLRLWRRFLSVKREILRDFFMAMSDLRIKLMNLGWFILDEGHSSSTCLIILNGVQQLQDLATEAFDLIFEEYAIRLRNAWKKDAERFGKCRTKITTIDKALESLHLKLSLPEAEEIKKEVRCFRQRVPSVQAKVAHCQNFCILLSSYFLAYFEC